MKVANDPVFGTAIVRRGAVDRDGDGPAAVRARDAGRHGVGARRPDGRGVGEVLAVADPADVGDAAGRLDVDVVVAVRAALVAGGGVVVRDALAAEVVVLGLDRAGDACPDRARCPRRSPARSWSRPVGRRSFQMCRSCRPTSGPLPMVRLTL